MSNPIKNKVVSAYNKCKLRAADRLAKGKVDSAAFYLERAASVMYSYNLIYEDDDLEELLRLTSTATFPQGIRLSGPATDCKVALVDSFGLSLRGLAWVYAKGIIDSGRELLFIVPDSAHGSSGFMLLEEYLLASNAEIAYIPSASFAARSRFIADAIAEFAPSSVFFHGTPWDVASLSVIASLPSNVAKYQVNLTDHAFWLGASVFDFYVEFREYGATVSALRRGIPEGKLIMMPYYPAQAIAKVGFSGLPFSDDVEFFVSGGSAYKTEGSDGFPGLVRSILDEHPRLVFLFLSNGDPTWLAPLEADYPGRIFAQRERSDLAEVIERSAFYLNTYPMYGGLMTQVSAMCGKVPVTLLLKGSEPAGRLLPRLERPVDFEDAQSALEEVASLMHDEGYRESRSAELRASIDGPGEFADRILRLLDGHPDPARPAPSLDDKDFLSGYIARGKGRLGLSKAIVSRESLRHATVLDPETWIGIVAICGERASRWLGERKGRSPLTFFLNAARVCTEEAPTRAVEDGPM